jgi:hypothetical protein
MAERPPLGIMPRDIWERKRMNDLLEAMLRYVEHGLPFPDKWLEEFSELATKYTK